MGPRSPGVSRGARLPVAAIAPLLFSSGLCALVYQSAWLRDLRLVFGASTAASAAVLAIFMGGLGAGGLLLGKRADARRDPLRLYADLELGVAAFAAVTPPLVALVRWLYGLLGGSVAMGAGLGTVVRLVLAALVLLPPTLLMGGTLPAAARAVETDDDAGRRNLAFLYGANTLGAVTGAGLSTFVLLEALGAHRMLWLACGLNVVVALAARLLARGAAPVEVSAAAAPAPLADAGPAIPARLVLGASAIVGFAFLLMELVWYRMLAPILGGSSYTFGLILVLALLGVGLGGAAYAAWMDRRPATLAGLALTCALEALFMAIPFALGDRLALLALAARDLGALGFGSLVLGWSFVAALVVLPAAFVSGVQFPLLIALLGRGSRGVGAHVGLAYAWNTVGAIVGSLAGGFGLLPALSAPGVWRGVVLLLAALGITAAWASQRGAGGSIGRAVLRVAPALGAAVLAALLLRAGGPTAVWRHNGIGAGRASLNLRSSAPNDVEDWARNARRTILWEVDGVESGVAVSAGEGVAFVVNGKVDGHAVIDGGTQILSGLLGALVLPDARRALVVGLGTGSTAGWLGAVPTLERVDVIELEPAILRVARDAAPVNQAVLDNPRVHLTIGDAREVLLVTRARYDLIFSEPSNPYRAGIASLFTREFYQAAVERLAPGGLFLQWLQAYEVDGQTVRTAIATLASVFPAVEIWVTEAGDFVLMASLEPRTHDAAQLRARIAAEPYKSALEKAWRVTDLEGLLAHYVASPGLAREIGKQEGGAVNTDDRNLLEFGFARNVGREVGFSDIDLWTVAHARNEDRPVLRGGPVDWERVAEQRRAFDVLVARQPRAGAAGPEFVKRTEAYAAFASKDLAGVITAWHGQARAPEGPFELEMIAEAYAEAGAEEALPVLERLRAFEPVEADALLARLRQKQGRPADVAPALEAALTGYRTEPWARLEVMRRLVADVAVDLGKDPALGRRAFAALGQPFAVLMLEDERREARLKLAQRLDLRGLCVDAVAAFGPNLPFRRELLAARRECYAAVGDPRLGLAEQDLAELTRLDPPTFGAGLTPP